MDGLVKNLLAAYSADIDKLDWMTAETKQKAQAKLAKFTPKIGYPDKWRDYSALQIDKRDLVGNVIRAQTFEYNRNLNKLGKPIDRSEWGMTPQTVNAYYNPEMNEIVFPAAILQPPFFDPQADDAVNLRRYRRSHRPRDQSRLRRSGQSVRWRRQSARCARVVHPGRSGQVQGQDQGAGRPILGVRALPGYHVNGELTLGENIADNAGLAIAYKAYQLVAEWQASAADRRYERRSAFLRRLGPGVSRQVTRSTMRSWR